MPKPPKDRGEKWNGMNWIRQDKRLAIYLRDGMACVWCGKGVEDGVQLTLDHLNPARGKHDADNRSCNLVSACKDCNMKRGKLNLSAWADRIALLTDQVADEVRRRVERHRRRSLTKYRTEARQLVADRGSAAKALSSLTEGE